MAGKVAVMGGCCGCEDDPPDGCSLALNVLACYRFPEPPCPDLYEPESIDYELYYPADAATPAFSGTLDFVAPPPAGGYHRYVSDVMTFEGYVPCREYRVRVIPGPSSGFGTYDQVRSICCYYPTGTATFGLFLPIKPGYTCACTDGPVPVMGASVTLNNRYGAVTLTRNTAAGLYPASPGQFNGTQLVPAVHTFTCETVVTDGVADYRLRLGPAADVPVYWSAQTSGEGCVWQVGWHCSGTSLYSGSVGPDWEDLQAIGRACVVECNPYPLPWALAPVVVPGTVTYAEILADPCYGPTGNVGAWGWRFGNAIDCRDFVQECVSRVPLLIEIAVPACPPCVGADGTTARCDFLPFHDGSGDLWTLTE